MKIAETPSDIKIDAKVIDILGKITDGLDDLLLRGATDTARKNGHDTVTTADVKLLITQLCDTIQRGLDKGDRPNELHPSMQAIVEYLRKL